MINPIKLDEARHQGQELKSNSNEAKCDGHHSRGRRVKLQSQRRISCSLARVGTIAPYRVIRPTRPLLILASTRRPSQLPQPCIKAFRRIGHEPDHHSSIGIYGMSTGGGHSGLMLAARITLPHFSTSTAMNLPKSAGEPGILAPPNSASRAFILGSARAALISLLSLSTISAGVLRGAPMPYHELAS